MAKAPCQSDLVNHWQSIFPNNPSPMPHMQSCFQTLQSNGFSIGLITNGGSIAQNAKIDALDLRASLDGVFISEELSCVKPQPKIFEIALRKLKLSPGESFYIGDHPVNDYIGALNAGMTPIWLSGFQDWPGDLNPARYSASNLVEATDLVLQLGKRGPLVDETS